MMKLIYSAALLTVSAVAHAQYAPQAGIPGSTAIARNSNQFVAWASSCTIYRGLQQIGNAAGGFASLGDSSSALGAPNGDVVSLGDSGVAVLRFAQPVINGPGADFAVFENGFANVSNPEEAFLELAFVEVSSDGVNYVRFPASSLTQDTLQLSPSAQPSYTNARQINNLAGKYTSTWGTPFDLDELVGQPGLDVNHITHVRIVDVIGSIGTNASLDAAGRKINDPFPSPFPGSGFDLDAVGVIHAAPAGVEQIPGSRIALFPNPAGAVMLLRTDLKEGSVLLFDLAGRKIKELPVQQGTTSIALQDLAAGTYFITVQNAAGRVWQGSVTHY